MNILHGIDPRIDPAELSAGSLHCHIIHWPLSSDNGQLTIFIQANIFPFMPLLQGFIKRLRT